MTKPVARSGVLINMTCTNAQVTSPCSMFLDDFLLRETARESQYHLSRVNSVPAGNVIMSETDAYAYVHLVL